jgi:hypothetical protein
MARAWIPNIVSVDVRTSVFQLEMDAAMSGRPINRPQIAQIAQKQVFYF